MTRAISVGIVLGAIVSVFWRFRHKSDGYGIKKQLTRYAVGGQILTPPYALILIWEAFDDLPHYAAAFRVLADFLAINLLMFVAIDWPVYLSFNESAQRGLSSISQEPENDEDEEASQVREVLELAGTGSDRAQQNSEPVAREKDSVESRAGKLTDTNTPPEAEAPALYSSKTLSRTLEDILLNPLYASQMASFTRHLIGEFNVEGLLFFLRVGSFRKFVDTGKRSDSTGNKPTPSARGVETHGESVELSELSASSHTEHSVVGGADGLDFGAEVAWKAMLVYFEFLAKDAPSEVRCAPLAVLARILLCSIRSMRICVSLLKRAPDCHPLRFRLRDVF